MKCRVALAPRRVSRGHGAEEVRIEASFCEAIGIAREQKFISLEKRAEGTYAEYRRQKASAKEDVDFDYLSANFLQFRPSFSVLPAGSFAVPSKVEFAVVIGDEALHPWARLRSFRNFIPKDASARYFW